MTSRPPLGVQQRQPQQHSLAGPSLSQRPAAHQRALSQQQQFLPPSPIRKETGSFEFTPPDYNDGANTRYSSQRRGGSRLKLELSHESLESITHTGIIESPNAIDSSKPFTPSRMMLPTDSSDLGDMSPHFSHLPTIDLDAPLPMPQRRLRTTPSTPRRGPPPIQATTTRKDVPPKPYQVEIPSAAPRYYTHGKVDSQPRKGGTGGAAGNLAPPPSIGYADFYPWIGNHPEDHFSENVIRQGHFDKPAFNPDTQSGKYAIFPSMKGANSSLHTLSAIFTAALGARRNNGQITSSSTFRYPPRVTVTDTKRELWLKDLANPASSLRRLARTIPHGLRGQALLDQCLNKRIPFERAVWLIQCVGANELRTCKRKGVSLTMSLGAEVRWIKEWTVSVQKFVENVLFSFDDKEWKAKVHYVVLLATHLYEQHLLDREPYMEWLVSSFENSNQNRLPMWMLITEIYWKDLLKLRKYGRRLVTALVSHHQLVFNHPDRDILQPLLSKSTTLLNTLILSSPENFVSPSVWSKYRDTIKACLPVGDTVRHDAFAAIASRNEQLMASGNRSQPAARHILVQWLDRNLQSPMSEEGPANSWNISKDKSALARALLEWCTSLYRPGKTKVYITSQLLQHWSMLGLDVTTEILDFLDADPCVQKERKDHLYHLVCELVRSDTFSVPRYIQWLSARGGITNSEDVLPDGPASTRLLAEIPPFRLSSEQKNLRSGMLRRASFSVDDEARDAEMALKLVRHTVGLPMDPTDPLKQRKPRSINKLSQQIQTASRALKAEIGRWLRDSVTTTYGGKDKMGSGGPGVSPTLFGNIRCVLEAAEDLSMLADVLRSLTPNACVEILAAIANTVSRHFFIFSALGVCKGLFNDLSKKLRAIYLEQGPGAHPLLVSLVTLAPRIPGMEEMATQLKKDLALSSRQNPVDACSPVSENMIARLQDDSNDLHEEIEKLLAAGTSVDRKTMENLFQTIIQRLHQNWGESADKQRVYSVLLARLRVFDMPLFDALMVKWIAYLRTLTNRPSIDRIFPLLVSNGCLTMPTILSSTSDSATPTPITRVPTGGSSWPQVVQITYRTRYMQETLKLLMNPLPPDYDLITPEEIYRFTNLQEQVLRENPKDMLSLIGSAMAEYSFARSQNDTEGLPLDDPVIQERLSTLIKLLVLKDAAGVGRALAAWAARSPDGYVGSWIDNMTTKLLLPSADRQTHITFDQILELTNEFTWPFCHLQLFLQTSAPPGDQNNTSNQQAADKQPSTLDSLTSAMDRAIDKKNLTWVGIVLSLNVEVVQQLKGRAQSRFLGLIPSPRESLLVNTVPIPEQSLQMAENLLSVIEALMRGSPPGARQPQLPPEVVIRLSDLWELLSNPEFDPAQKQQIITKWLPLMLNFITLHTQAFDASKTSSDIRARLLVVCAGLMQELDALHGPGCHTRGLVSRVFDLSCVLSDNLPEEQRGQCVRALFVGGNAGGDGRLRYILSWQGTNNNGNEGVWVSVRERERGRSGGGGGQMMMMGQGQQQQPMKDGIGFAVERLGVPGNLWGPLPGVGVVNPGNNNPGQVGGGGERLSPFAMRKWDYVHVPTGAVVENDTGLDLSFFEARGPRVWPAKQM
ncbi:putative mediator of RNA polymerase II transcription [Triangularia setosa]|uniref:Mediator of RNA polymerase II transcription subunit 12 n=1 Tax=Triangularia setosa TaxID=2587417 RepID=A0AAN6WCA3_9PEZI|nr:putative mediator of RNA polymerase II transcription [Podospora setosa]